MAGGARRLARPLQEIRLSAGVGSDRDRQLEETERLVVRAERDRSVCRRRERDPRLRGEGVGLGAFRRVGVGRQVVAGEAAGELIGVEGLEEARGGEVAGLTVGFGERVVRHFPDEGLHERVLAALG